MTAMTEVLPFDGTQSMQQWQEHFVHSAKDKPSLVVQAFDYGFAANVHAILDSVRERLGEKWTWTWDSLMVALVGIEGEGLYSPQQLLLNSYVYT